MSLKTISILTLVLLCLNALCGSLKILGVFPHFPKSHSIMNGNLMKHLAQRGHQVDVISQFPQKKPVPNYTDIVIKTKEGRLLNNFTYDHLRLFSSLSVVKNTAKMAGPDTCESLGHPGMQKVLRTTKGYYDVIIVEMFLGHCFLALGQHLGAPVVGVVAMKQYDWLAEPFGNPLNPSYVPSIFSYYGQRMTFWQRLENTLRMAYVTRATNYYMEAQVEQVERYFGRKLSSMSELYDDVSLILVNSHRSMNDIKPLTPDIIEVGGLHISDDDQQLTADLQKWLDESTNGCVYFSFGSLLQIETFPEDMIRMLYETFSRIAPVRVLLKVAQPALLPPGLPKSVKTATWMPQIAVLKHKNVKLFVTHGGLLGTQESVAYGVPMVGVPIFVDQHTNVRLCVEKKIAVAVDFDETLTADLFTNAIKTVLSDPVYRHSIERISNLFWDRPMGPVDTAIYWVEYTARHGTVLKSPATKLNWWQLHLLDVYGFILLYVLMMLYIIKKITVFLFRHLYCKRGDASTSFSTKKASLEKLK